MQLSLGKAANKVDNVCRVETSLTDVAWHDYFSGDSSHVARLTDTHDNKAHANEYEEKGQEQGGTSDVPKDAAQEREATEGVVRLLCIENASRLRNGVRGVQNVVGLWCVGVSPCALVLQVQNQCLLPILVSAWEVSCNATLRSQVLLQLAFTLLPISLRTSFILCVIRVFRVSVMLHNFGVLRNSMELERYMDKLTNGWMVELDCGTHAVGSA